MTREEMNPTFFEEVLGALAIVCTIFASPLIRPWYRKWGASGDEVRKALPGDDLVPEPRLESTRAVTIDAPAANIWPWLVQMGQKRGGLYSYERLENVAGCEMRNADQIVPEWQAIEIGDQVGLGPEGYPAFDVAAIDPSTTLILRGDTPNPEGRPTTWIWIFYLKQKNANTTRLLLRTRLDFEPTLPNKIAWRLFTDPISFNMERAMLQGIKRRVEAS